MTQRSGPVGGRRRTRRVRVQPPVTPNPRGNRAERRAAAKTARRNERTDRA